jgi:arylsulfatase A-like enzyme
LSEKQWRQVIASYYGQITFLDQQVGRIVDALERAGRLDSTIIVFTSDHGDFMAEHGVLGKPECFFDCLMRVAMIIAGAPRGRDYKLCMYAGGFVELYDLVNDPGEMHNLADAPAHACGAANWNVTCCNGTSSHMMHIRGIQWAT